MHYIFYEARRNSPETLILCHDIGLDSTCWEELVPFLREHYSVLTIDLGGNKCNVNKKISWDQYCSDLNQLIEKMDISGYHLVGHGFGASVIKEYAVKYPDWQGKIVLMSPPRIYSRKYVNKQLGNLLFLIDRSMSAFADYLLPRKTIRKPKSREFQKLHRMIQGNNRDQIKKMIELLQETYSSISDIRKVQQPVLVMLGEHDIFNMCYSGWSNFFYTNCRLNIIANASNYMFIDNPVETAKQVIHFLQQEDDHADSEIRDEMMEDLYTSVLKYVRFVYSKNNEPTLPKLQVNFFDQYQVKVNNVVLSGSWDTRNAKRILAYLVFHPYSTREQICDALWPHMDLNRARANLRVYLNHLNSIFRKHPEASSILHVTRETVELHASIECDAVNYLKLIDEAFFETNHEKKRSIVRAVLKTVPDIPFPGIYDEWVLELVDRMYMKIEQLVEWAEKVTKFEEQILIHMYRQRF